MLSGIALAVRPAVMSGPRTAFEGVLPIVPTAQRQFTSTDEVTAFVRVSQGRAGPLSTSIVTRILDASGRLISETRNQDVSTEYQMNIPLFDLESGEYLLELLADSGSDRASRRLRFTIR